MKIRLILLCLAGVAAYIMLANFHSNMLKETESPKDHGQASAPHGQAAVDAGARDNRPEPPDREDPVDRQARPPETPCEASPLRLRSRRGASRRSAGGDFGSRGRSSSLPITIMRPSEAT